MNDYRGEVKKTNEKFKKTTFCVYIYARENLLTSPSNKLQNKVPVELYFQVTQNRQGPLLNPRPLRFTIVIFQHLTHYILAHQHRARKS